MKLRMRFFSFCLALCALLGLFSVPVKMTFAADKSFSEGDVMERFILQFYTQDDAKHNYKWITLAQENIIFGKTMDLDMVVDGNALADASENTNVFGFQIGDGGMEYDETAAVHFRLENVVFHFNNHEDFALDMVFDYDDLWKCFKADWGGQDGNSTTIKLNDEFSAQFPDEKFYDIAKDLTSISCKFIFDYYEYGALSTRNDTTNTANTIIEAMKSGVTVSNALDLPNCVGDEITEEMIDTYKALGYKAVRIPVCFDNHMSSDYTIDATFMDKVKDAVAIVTSKDMYAVLALVATNGWADPGTDNATPGKNHITKVWSQIADAFLTYDNYLCFELLDKPKSQGSAIASGEINQNLSDWYASSVKTIRATGGNNKTRVVILNPYNNLANNVSGITLPNDKNIAFSVAVNAPYDFTTSVGGVNPAAEWNASEKIGDIRSVLNIVNKAVEEKKIPVIISEYGATDKNNYQDRVNYAYDFVKLAQEYGYVCFWNDNGVIKKETAGSFGIVNRADGKAAFPSIAEAAVAAATGKSLPALKDAVLPEDYEGIEETKPGESTSQPGANNSGNEEQPKKNKTVIVVVAVVAAVVLLGAVVVLMVVFKKRNGTFI